MFGSNVVGHKFGRKSAPTRPWKCEECSRENPGYWSLCPVDSTPRPKE